MEIQNDNNGRKWIRAAYKNYLVGNSQAEDKDKIVAHSVLVPDWASADEWHEVDEAEALRIKAAKAQTGTIEYPEEITATMSLMRMKVNDMGLTDTEALAVQSLYPEWETLWGRNLPEGFRLQHGGKLYNVLQAHTAQQNWEPGTDTAQQNWEPGTDTASLYALTGEAGAEHAGTQDDPIPYEQMMLIEQGKYYTEDGVLYRGLMDAPNGYPNDLKDLPTLAEPVTDEE